jgi:hypothetical protein
MIAVSALILAVAPTFILVFTAEILHGLSGGIVTPAIAAISLGLVGRTAMSARTGRNNAYDAAGNDLTAGAMGAAGQYISKSAIFLGAAALCIPALIALLLIRGDEIDYARARNAGIGRGATNFQRIFDLGKNLRVRIFAACIFLFQLADASMLPVISQDLAQDKNKSASLLMASLIVTPQIIAASLSPWIGYYSEKFGRKPLLLIGLGIEILRALLFAGYTSYPILIVGQSLGGISAACVTVLTVLMIADMTTGTGRFNLVQGFIGTVIAIAAAISTGASGFLFEKFGHLVGFFRSCCSSGRRHLLVLGCLDRNKTRQIPRLKLPSLTSNKTALRSDLAFRQVIRERKNDQRGLGRLPLDGVPFGQSCLAPKVSAILAPRAPIGFGRPVVVSLAV